MPIIRKHETLPAQPVIVLIYGQPGTSKTSLSNTCKNALNCDFDYGFKRSFGVVDSFQPTGWGEIIQELNLGAFDEFDTIVIDTAKGALDDFLMLHVQQQDYKLKTNKLKMFGAIGEEFKSFVSTLRLKKKDIFIIAHDKTEEDGDIKKRIPDVTGQSNALLLRIADQVGYLSMRNGQRVLSFNPSDTTVGKNVANLPDLVLPSHTDAAWDGFADREIIQKVKDALSAHSEEQKASIELIANYRTNIDNVALTDTALKALMETWKDEPEYIRLQLRSYFGAHLKANGWKYYADKTAFAPIAAIEPPVVAETPPVEAEKEPDLFEAKEGE